MTYKCCSLRLFWFFFSNFLYCLLLAQNEPIPVFSSNVRTGHQDLAPLGISVHRAVEGPTSFPTPIALSEFTAHLHQALYSMSKRTFSFMCQSFRVDVLRSAMWAWGWAPLYCLGMLRGEKEIKNFNSCLAQQSIGKDKESTEFIKQIWITCGSWRQTNPVIKEACINYTRVL